ncbi:MAG TPA: DUF362 domain-containing protein [Bacteroidales bacterium]|jgi:uncharacterized protein (DUF362 family)/Pyruvate/2-oxoacid:ferredoxin oxidoreductase delta subunit|nr:DUF362 domain-containing protein [Bacteroidales bacterium]HNR42903.1 DUF362 domain-containing protein [Bacteroidales bacterium]HPM18273.1 DUF362 domain-containing protein [Bacteroidales bacterium]HQG76687.1 DUF362 domain-containing protein [Bacteroidales bacterium]
MNTKVAVRKCTVYDVNEVYTHISRIFGFCGGPGLRNRTVLLKPNILSDNPPEKCISTHPVVVEAMVRFLRDEGAKVVLGDSPAIHTRGFRAEKSGIENICREYGIEWIDFSIDAALMKVRDRKIRIASVINEVDLIISLPKLKNHELVYFTGAIKNTLGLVPGFSKAKLHARYQDRESFSRFLVDLNERVTPHFFLMDGIMGMEGRGPGQGTPANTGVLIGSENPLALDIIASEIIGYNPWDIPTNRIALARAVWLGSPDDIVYAGPPIESIIKKDFRRIIIERNTNISIRFLRNRISFMRKLDRRPVFIHRNCTSCGECIKICPSNALRMHAEKQNHVVLNDAACIRCYCCSEVCKHNAVVIRRKLLGV